MKIIEERVKELKEIIDFCKQYHPYVDISVAEEELMILTEQIFYKKEEKNGNS